MVMIILIRISYCAATKLQRRIAELISNKSSTLALFLETGVRVNFQMVHFSVCISFSF